MEPLATTLAPASPAPARREFSAGAVIGRAFSAWLGSFAPFSVVALLVNVPVFVLLALAPPDGSRLESLANLLGSLANLVVTGALTYGVLQGLQGRPVPLGALFKTGFGKLGSVLLVSFGVGLVVVLGLVLLVVPGLVAMSALYVAVPAVVVEDVRPGAALGRSRALTKGSRWGILAVALVVGVVTIAIVGGASLLVVLLASTLPHPLPPLLAHVVVALSSPLGACAAAVAYHDLRVAKEGVDTATLVKVFE